MKITKYIPKAATQKVARQILVMKKNSPHVAFGVGIVGVLGGTILACRATLRVSPILEEMREDIDAVKRDLSDMDGYKQDLAYAYAHGTVRIVKQYAPAVVVTGLSVAALTGSHISLVRRNTALTIAYAGVQKAYDDYRERVREQYGVDKELDIYHAVENEKTKIDGKVHELKTADPNKFSPYARFFDECSTEWVKDPELNRLFVTAQQNYLNQLLQVRGHVFLNEVYDALGIERSSAGQVVGWVIGEKGDNYMDFGLYEARNARFINGTERSILLDFNVDGVIYDLIG